jgi:folate-binding protein YgfZ
VYARPRRGILVLAGADAVRFLQGVLTNDISGLQPGQACYAAYLTPQGRMISDMDVLPLDDEVLLDVEPDVPEMLAARFDATIFTEDVRIANRTGGIVSAGVYGPSAATELKTIIGEAGAGEVPGPDFHVTVPFDGGELIVLGTRRGGVDGFHVFGPPPQVASLIERLGRQGVATLGELAAESLRIENGVPRFGTDMTDETIPLEAGIESRAISMTKGCYVGQEVIVRILHRGHGRVVRKLAMLRVEGDDVPAPGVVLLRADKAVGHVTSAVRSPRLGVVALGYVHRDVLAEGTTLVLDQSRRAVATVAAVP